MVQWCRGAGADNRLVVRFRSCCGGRCPDEDGLAFFEKRIRPVLVEHCYRCHAADAKSVRGGLVVDTRDGLITGGDSGAAIVPGKPDESLLIEALRYESYEMPPEGKLPDDIIDDFVRWVEMGAPDPRDGDAPLARKGSISNRAASTGRFSRSNDIRSRSRSRPSGRPGRSIASSSRVWNRKDSARLPMRIV